VTAEYLSIIEARRNNGLSLSQTVSSAQLDLNLVSVD
jgi:hypothetical protein